eukprot:10716798-Alexandrium_andersonii.AAC.1
MLAKALRFVCGCSKRPFFVRALHPHGHDPNLSALLGAAPFGDRVPNPRPAFWGGRPPAHQTYHPPHGAKPRGRGC